MKSRYLLLLGSLGLSTASMDSIGLMARANGQNCAPGKNLTACPSNIPFCCPSSTNCVPTLGDNSSVICCPQGQNCDFIEPITCEIQQQNQTLFPVNAMHTTQLNAILAPCGSQCCPLGYSCQAGMCIMTKTSPTLSSSSSSVSQTSSSTTSTAPTSTSTNPPPPQSSSLPPGQIAGIVIGSLAGISLILMLLLLCLRRRRHQTISNPSRDQRNPYSPDFMGTTPRPFSPGPNPTGSQTQPETRHVGSTVSEPMWAPSFGESHRTDFLLRRGSNQTGFEQQNQPSWSNTTAGIGTTNTSSLPNQNNSIPPKEPQHSFNPSDRIPFTDPYTPNPNNTTSSTSPPPSVPILKPAPRSRLSPLFQTPLRLGIPNTTTTDGTTPQPTRRNPPKRPRRSDEPRLSIAQALNLSQLKHKPSGTFVSARKNGSASGAGTPTTTLRRDHDDEDKQQRDRLVPNAASAAAHDPTHGLSRSSSDATAFSDTSSSIHLSHSGSSASNHGYQHQDAKASNRHDSAETINVLLPPPSVFESPAPPPSVRTAPSDSPGSAGKGKGRAGAGLDVGARPETTFAELMEKAGWRREEWRAA